MNRVTPGKKLILELLAKSIAKIEAAEAENQDAKRFVKTEADTDLALKEEMKEEREENDLRRRDEKEAKLIDGEEKRAVKLEVAGGFQIKKKDHSKPVKTVVMDYETDLNTKPKKKKELEEDRKKKKLEREENRQKKKLERVEKKQKKNLEREENRQKKKLERDKKILEREENREKKDLKRVQNREKKRLKREENSRLKNCKVFKRAAGKSLRRFTLEEDAILFDVIQQFGDKINVQQIAKDLKRNPQSIIDRLSRLRRTGKSIHVRYHCFTLTEDLAVLDAALKYLDSQSLRDLSLPNRDWVAVGEQIGRERLSPRKRWEYTLKPWILQHYSGTLNLDIRRPLANYLAEHFEDINSIDWPSVISKTEFAGHTIPSLRKKFTDLIMCTKQAQNELSEEITLEMIAAFSNIKYVLGGRQVSETELKRQKEIIEYFDCYVKTNCITDFLG